MLPQEASYTQLQIAKLKTAIWSITCSNDSAACHDWAKDFVNSKNVVLAVGCISLFHCFIIWDNTDRRASGREASDFGEIVHKCCLTVYMVDFGLRCFVERSQVVKSAWNWLDIIIITAEISSEICKLGGQDFSMGGLQALRIFKVCRFVSWFKELRMLVKGVVGSLRILFWSFILLFTFLLGWATLTVELVHPIMDDVHRHTREWHNCERCPRAFASVLDASLTLFSSTNAGDSWGRVAIPVIERYPLTALIFVGSQFTLIVGALNIVVAVLVDGAAEARARDTSQRAREAIRQEAKEKKVLEKIFRRIDVDGSGVLTFPDLVRGVGEVPELHERLRVMDIQESELHELFMMLDGDGSGEVDPEEFIETLYRMKCGDEKTASTFVKHYVVHMKKDQAAIAEKIGEIELSMQDLKGWRNRSNDEVVQNFQRHTSSADPSRLRLSIPPIFSRYSGAPRDCTVVDSKRASVEVLADRAPQPHQLVSSVQSREPACGRSTQVVAVASNEVQHPIATPRAVQWSTAARSPRKPQFAMTPRPGLLDANASLVEATAMREHLMIMVRRAEIDIHKEINRLMDAEISSYKNKIQALTQHSGPEVGKDLDLVLALPHSMFEEQIDKILKGSLAPIRAWQDLVDYSWACPAENFHCYTLRSPQCFGSDHPGACIPELPTRNALPSSQRTDQQQPQDPDPPRDVHVYLVKDGPPNSPVVKIPSIFSRLSSSHRPRSENMFSRLTRGRSTDSGISSVQVNSGSSGSG